MKQLSLGAFALCCTLLAPFAVSRANAAETTVTYTTVREIAYRGESPDGADDYMRERCKLDLYHPDNSPGYATVVWFHGGGLSSGEKSVPEQLKNQGIAVAAVNYRLFPKVKAPAYIDDSAAAVAWVMKHIGEYGGNPDLVFVSGHSAGGYLTLMVGLDKRWLEKYGVDTDQIAGLVPFSGHTITHFAIRKERRIPDKQPVVDEYAPLYHVRADAPPLLLITGDREMEMLGRYEETAYLARMMKVAGHKRTALHELGGFDHGGMAEPAMSLLLREVQAVTEENGKAAR